MQVNVPGVGVCEVIDDLASQYFVKDPEGNEFFIFKNQCKEITNGD